MALRLAGLDVDSESVTVKTMSEPKPYTLERFDMDCEMDELSSVAHRDIRATVEALERVTLRAEKAERELGASRNIVTEQREDADRCIAALVRERDEARADAALCRIALENCTAIEVERDLLRAESSRLRETAAERDALKAALREMVERGEGCPACGDGTRGGCGCRYERAREALKGGGK